ETCLDEVGDLLWVKHFFQTRRERCLLRRRGLSRKIERNGWRSPHNIRRQDLMSNRKVIFTAFALASTLAFGLQPGWSQTSGASSNGSSSQGLGSVISGSTGSSGSRSGRSSSARSSADCPEAALLPGRSKGSGSSSSSSKSSSESTGSTSSSA